MADWMRAVAAHAVWPGLVLFLFLRIQARMGKAAGTGAPILETFALFLVYGGILHLWLTELIDAPWSAIASLEAAFLTFFAPLLMLAVAWWLWLDRDRSRYHRRLVIASLAYPLVLGSSIGFGVLLAADR